MISGGVSAGQGVSELPSAWAAAFVTKEPGERATSYSGDRPSQCRSSTASHCALGGRHSSLRLKGSGGGRVRRTDGEVWVGAVGCRRVACPRGTAAVGSGTTATADWRWACSRSEIKESWPWSRFVPSACRRWPAGRGWSISGTTMCVLQGCVMTTRVLGHVGRAARSPRSTRRSPVGCRA